MTDTEHNNVISEGIDFIKTLDRNGQMGKKYYNIPPKCHINMIHDGIDFINKINCNERRNTTKFQLKVT